MPIADSRGQSLSAITGCGSNDNMQILFAGSIAQRGTGGQLKLIT